MDEGYDTDAVLRNVEIRHPPDLIPFGGLASARGCRVRQQRTGFTILEIMITVAVLLIVASIAAPYYLRYRESGMRSACIANMKQIADAVSLAQFHGIANPDRDHLLGVAGTVGYLRSMPYCPASKLDYTQFDPPECPTLELGHNPQ